MNTEATSERDRKRTRVQSLLSVLLRTGVLLSAALVISGLAIGAWREPAELNRSSALSDLRDARAGTVNNVGDVGHQVLHLRPSGVVMAGLLILVLTPLARVALSLVLFTVEGDRTFVAITAVVLAMLLLSFALGHAGG